MTEPARTPSPTDDAARRRGSHRSVATLVTVTLVSVATVLLGGLGAMNYSLAIRDERARLATSAATQADQLAAGLALPLWNFDRPQVDKVIESAMRAPEVYGIEVRQPDVSAPGGITTYARVRGDHWEIRTPDKAIPKDGMLVEERKIGAPGAELGTVTLAMTSRFVDATLRRELIALATRVVALDVLLVLILSILLRRTVLLPLREVERYAADVSSGGGRGKPGMGEARFYGEIEGLRESIERMVELLDQRYAALRQTKTFSDAVFDNVPAVLSVYDRDGRLIRWNAKVREMTGRTDEELRHRLVGDGQPDEERELIAAAVRRVLETGHVVTEATLISKDGRRIPFYYTGVRMILDGEPHILTIGMDISERKRAEAILLESEKMRTVAGLAAGMAHEINNPLAGMLQNAQVILNRLKADTAVNRQVAEEVGTSVEVVNAYMNRRGIPQMLDAIRSSGERAAEIVANMLSFSRTGDAQVRRHKLTDVLDGAIDLAHNDYDLKKFDFRNIRLVRDYADDLPDVPCRATEIQQVVLNLLKNAAQAMPERVDDSAPPGIVVRAVRDNGCARIEVHDNGPGMAASVRHRIFEPFFTTKDPQSGTGLGLFVSYCIITRNHRGTIAVESDEGCGTRFTITLPLAAEEA